MLHDVVQPSDIQQVQIKTIFNLSWHLPLPEGAAVRDETRN